MFWLAVAWCHVLTDIEQLVIVSLEMVTSYSCYYFCVVVG